MTSLDSDEAPIEFVIPASGEEYMDLSHARIRIRAKILTEEGESLVRDKNFVAPVNNFLHSMFSNVQVELNQKCITPQSSLYNYRAMIENILNYSGESKKTHLTTSLFYKDTATKMNAEAGNAGYEKRLNIALNGEFDMESHIHSDIFNQNKYMVNGVQMVLKFFKAKPDFALYTVASDTAKYKIKITEAVLLIRKLKMSPAILVAHANVMLKHPARYSIVKCELKTITIPKNVMSTTLDNIFLGQLPQRIIVLFVDALAFNGTLKSNPFNFEHFNHNYLSVATDAALHVTPLKPNYAAKLYIQSYNTLYTNTGINFSDTGSDITREEFANGYNISVFDLTSDISAHDPHWGAQNTGSLRIEVQFAQNLTKTVTAIVYAEFNNLIEIDKHRQVSLDFAA